MHYMSNDIQNITKKKKKNHVRMDSSVEKYNNVFTVTSCARAFYVRVCVCVCVRTFCTSCFRQIENGVRRLFIHRLPCAAIISDKAKKKIPYEKYYIYINFFIIIIIIISFASYFFPSDYNISDGTQTIIFPLYVYKIVHAVRR